MTATRSTRQNHHYKLEKNKFIDKECSFCLIGPTHNQYVEETKTMKVIRNKYPYSIWDGQGVTDHLMIVPKRHTDRLDGMNKAEFEELVKLMGKYESDGYNVYARSPGSSIKSMQHQHTHLIKLDNKNKKFIFLLNSFLYARISH